MGEHLRGTNLIILVDNKAVVDTFRNLGTRNVQLSRGMFDILHYAHKLNIRISMQWVPTKEQLADDLSRRLSIIEIKLRHRLGSLLVDFFSPTVDLFASRTYRLTDVIDFCAQYPDDLARNTDGLCFEPRTSDVGSCAL